MPNRFFIFILFIIILSSLSCRERTNVFDILDDEYIPPPHIALTRVSGVYYDPEGYLIGVRIEIDFTDKFEKALPIFHEFYQDISLRLEFEEDILINTKEYSVDVFGPYEIGWYCLKINFGDMPIGACLFEVIADNNTLIIKNTQGQIINKPLPEKWSAVVEY